MTLADVTRLGRFWAHTPPLRDLVAAFMGYRPPRPSMPLAPEALPLPEFEEGADG